MPVPYAGWGPGWDDWYDWYGWNNDFAAGAIVGSVAGAAIGAAASSNPAPAVGTVFATLPGDCQTVVRSSVTYHHCGPTWFKAQFLGTTVQYVVVSPPG